MYSTDASLYRVVPGVVVRPRHVDEIEAALRTTVNRTTRWRTRVRQLFREHRHPRELEHVASVRDA
jgi:hypothetical protein